MLNYIKLNYNNYIIMKFEGNNDYDKYLSTVKKNRLVRLDNFCGMSKGIKHQCTDKKCARIWKPSPSMVINDDFHGATECIDVDNDTLKNN